MCMTVCPSQSEIFIDLKSSDILEVFTNASQTLRIRINDQIWRFQWSITDEDLDLFVW